MASAFVAIFHVCVDGLPHLDRFSNMEHPAQHFISDVYFGYGFRLDGICDLLPQWKTKHGEPMPKTANPYEK